jgi:hypothetical protein
MVNIVRKETPMPLTSKQRDLRRRQRRVRKIRELKKRIENSTDAVERKRLTEKLLRISPFEAVDAA